MSPDATPELASSPELGGEPGVAGSGGEPARQVLTAAVETAIGAGGGFSLVLLDVDDFAVLDAASGRADSESVVRLAGQVITRALRSDETLVRDGDEFALLLDRTGRGRTWAFVERIRQVVEETAWETGASTVTVCAGIAMWDPQAGGDAAALIAAADAALAQARAGGANRVVVAGGGLFDAGSDPDGGADVVNLPVTVRDLLYLHTASAPIRERLNEVAAAHGLVTVPDEQALVLMFEQGLSLLQLITATWSPSALRQVLARATSAGSGVPGVAVPAVELCRRLGSPWLPRVLAERSLRPALQPIVRLDTGARVGIEALVRATHNGTSLSAAAIIDAARAHNLLFTMDVVAWTAALDHGMPLLADGERLHYNLSPVVLDDPSGYLHTIKALGRRADLSRVVVEISEVDSDADLELLAGVADGHRDLGAGVAVDRAGGGLRTLQHVRRLRPDMVKLDMGLTRGVEPGDPRLALIRAVVEHAHASSAVVVAVGIETAAECASMRELGIDLGQGHYLGRPA
jgi:diguanylate cyclase (GGDEF)-like protein